MSTRLISSKVIRTEDMGGAADLLCPRCGADNLHHGTVTTYDRAEDGKTVIETRLDGSAIAIDASSEGAGNPSRRRDGLVIDFWCEQCGDAPIQLCIAQHKGSTEIGWRFDPTRADSQ
jgi:predicted RNA-binding Zn-ribbon protein involved in translation (DUF1610 family)